MEQQYECEVTAVQSTNEHGFVQFYVASDGEVVVDESGKKVSCCAVCCGEIDENQGQGCLCCVCESEAGK